MNMNMQDALGVMADNNNDLSTYVDIVFVIDGTGSMQPLINKVKTLALSLHEKLEEGLRENKRRIDNLRAKVIVFRDYYVDGNAAMEESVFFELPDANNKFHDFVSNITASGGGDEPESGLEALALALRSDFITGGDRQRHVIVLFTDASAHRYEKQKEGVPNNYPSNMFRSLDDLYRTWGTGQDALGVESNNMTPQMSKKAKHLVLFAPAVYPWKEIEENFENTMRREMNKGNGGAELDIDDIIKMLSCSIA